ncbi:two-component regulatory system, sensor kinase protein [Arcticibacter svalbardensis MN12-7]|uniref:histidine kinase n=1 Tax=Arcticibacter svalbardensis MN12-7 TaxID=1150600 RepID=R9GRQ5_9SPHI|nr:HAMP domain-containing sensor histidine kinase [Arcticibacter svalbardensis]EOR94406.1 two-component regulatory system, sensor kinase protein [Arcticibacter svalbardensis MN12-7]
MKKRSIALILGLMSAALFGVIAMQYYFIRESYVQKSQLFDLSVNSSLSEVTNKLAKQDAMLFVKRKAIAEELKKNAEEKRQDRLQAKRQVERFTTRINALSQNIEKDFKKRDSTLRSKFPRIMTIDNDFYETYFRDPDQLSKVHFKIKMHQSVDDYGQVFQNEVHELYVDNAEGQKLKKARSSVKDTVFYLIEDPVAGIRVVSLPRKNQTLIKELALTKEQKETQFREQQLREQRHKEAKSMNQFFSSAKKTNHKSAIFEDLANDYEQFDIPLLRRVNPRTVDTLLQTELINRGINLDYSYKISTANSDSLLFSSISNVEGKNDDLSIYHTTLFPKGIISDTGLLTVMFPGKNQYMFQNMHAVLASSASLLLVLIGCFAFTIMTIFRQKKLSEMKTDFINNMTHEFKTPVATIMIASEALKDPEITEDKSRISRLAGIIYDENIRLGNHIERVLNIAKLDKGDLKLDFMKVEMNDLISAISDSMELQFQKKNAKVQLDLQAEHAAINGDELHLSNVIFNLIDNALKYSKEIPEIKISTFNTGKKLVIRVSDHGVGMSKDHQSKIFEQFYRIPTGNLHDVKGFGLGLSYVHDIVSRHRGEIKVKSEKDKGSDFEIIFHTV